MYQQFFYLAVAVSMIVSTIVMLFLTVTIYKKNLRSRSRERRPPYPSEQDLHESLVAAKIDIYTHICLLYEFDSDEYKVTQKKIGVLQEELNESRD